MRMRWVGGKPMCNPMQGLSLRSSEKIGLEVAEVLRLEPRSKQVGGIEVLYIYVDEEHGRG